jgi:Domain of unknown function (DUF1844)
MSEEEKGFVIKDRRSFDEKGELKESEPRKAPPEKAPGEPPKKRTTETTTPPLPEVSFTGLIFSLSSSALFHMGEIADPATGEKKKDLGLAKHAVDTIAMLREKTAGNLTPEEQKFVENVLTDLRWRYVKAKD